MVRRYLSVRQEDLAEATGISLATLQRLESGEVGSKVQVKQLLACAAALGVPFMMLIPTAWLEDAEQSSRAEATTQPAKDESRAATRGLIVPIRPVATEHRRGDRS